MLIGLQTAEMIKKEIGVAYPQAEDKEMTITGRNISQGIPHSFVLSSASTLEALAEPLNGLVMAIKLALENTPPELCSDITDSGILLTGGGAMLKHLDQLIAQETGLPVLLAEDPLTCVVKGCGLALGQLDRIDGIFTND
jgi:rod shape-determining protein MreB